MLTIEHCEVSENITMGDLFDQIGFSSLTPPNDKLGDSYIPNIWGIEVLSMDKYYFIDGFRWTKLDCQVKLCLQTIKQSELLTLICSPEHLVLCQNSAKWKMVRDLKPHDQIITQLGLAFVNDVKNLKKIERLCDIQVSTSHSYFANKILSHNSHFLTMLGANALKNGKNVLHYTFELSETSVGIRYDSNLCDMESNQIIDNKDDVLEKYKNMQLGRLIIKEFPTNSASIYTIRSHIERLDIKGFQPNLIIIDYADIMRSSRQFDSLRHELKLIYEELRGFAAEKGIPIWTASQSNREGANSDIVDLNNMSEAYGKAMVADIVLSISRKSHEKASGWGRLFIAKNRAGRDGIVYPVKIDTARSKFEITGQAGSLEDTKISDDIETKRKIRTKWQELKNEFSGTKNNT